MVPRPQGGQSPSQGGSQDASPLSAALGSGGASPSGAGAGGSPARPALQLKRKLHLTDVVDPIMMEHDVEHDLADALAGYSNI